MHTICTFHTHVKEFDSRISNVETSMTTSKHYDISHMSKIERNIAGLQDHFKTHEKRCYYMTSKLKEDGQAFFLIIKQYNMYGRY